MIGISGIGVVGSAVSRVFEEKKINIIRYDKYRDNYNDISKLLRCNIIFLCLPTLFSEELKEYDKSAIYENCDYLMKNNYKGLVVLKSTIEPGTTREIHEKYKLNILFNPEFLSARTAYEDFKNQEHIVIGGRTKDDKNILILEEFYKKYWENADISKSIYEEAEMMKIGVNSFYAVKIQFFNEIYLLMQKYENTDYNNVIKMILKNGWISPHHTRVPGTDGKLSYGGMCFPKDTNALNELMKRKGTLNNVLDSTILENLIMYKAFYTPENSKH
jgi:nucleotide sugar dehydrogenase